MRMIRFRVCNYKKINDSDWIDVGNMTAFVGKNESGKSTIFKGLSKLNPSDGSTYDGLKEFPRSRYTEDFATKNWHVSSAEFALDDNDLSNLKNESYLAEKIKSITMTRYYDGTYSMELNPNISEFELLSSEYLKILQKWNSDIGSLTAPEGKGDLFAPIKSSIIQILDEQIKNNAEINYVVDTCVLDIKNAINSQLNEDWQRTIFEQIIEDVESLLSKFQINLELDKILNWMFVNMPTFAYFDRYDVLDSAVHIDEFIKNLSDHPDDPKIRITKCLFEHVGLDIEKMQKLDISNAEKTKKELRRMADERSIQMNAASQSMTKKFSSWWNQRRHKFVYKLDGQNFRVWVSDDLDESEIELDQRSAGLQYFFSFYLVFLVEANKNHSNSILLLDEPGLQFHGTAQQKTVEFMEKISETNQLLYTTHSPFMLDGDHLENIKIVYEDKKSGDTKISDKVWPPDKDSLFPLQAALGYSLAQTLFHSKFQLIVEGLSDYTILKAMNELLASKSLKTLDEKITIVPAGGTRNIMPLASLLHRGQIKIITMLDGDQPGLNKQKELKEKLLLDSIIMDNFTEKTNSEIEDMFDDNTYADAVSATYSGMTIDFNSQENKILPIVNKFEAMFERNSLGKFEKWKVCTNLIKIINSTKISDTTCNKFEKLFIEINSKLT